MTAGQLNGSNHVNNHTQPVDHYTTRAIHIGSHPDPSTGAVIPSLSVATTYLQDGVNKPRGFEYSRSSNPTRKTLEEVLTSLETSPVGLVGDGNGGARDDESGGETLVFASGSAGTAALAAWVSLEEEEGGAGGVGKASEGGGGHVLAVNDVVSHSRCLMLPHGFLCLSVCLCGCSGRLQARNQVLLLPPPCAFCTFALPLLSSPFLPSSVPSFLSLSPPRSILLPPCHHPTNSSTAARRDFSRELPRAPV